MNGYNVLVVSVSIVFARCVRDELQRRGVDSGKVFARAAIDEARFGDLRERLSFEQVRTLAAEAVEASREPALGLLLGNSVPLHMLQLVGHLLLSQASLEEAVSALQRFSSLLADGLRWQVEREGQDVFVSLALPGELTPCLADFALALMARVSRSFMTPGLELADFDAKRVAKHLGMGLRTLRRRLTAEGTSLRRLFDQARCWHACKRLRLPDANIKRVAAELGFSEPTAFHRAFRRWTGVTPAAFANGRDAS